MLFDVFKCFMPECCLDTNLVEVLLERSNSVNHKKGNSSIVEKMNDPRLVDGFVVAVIDDDKIKVKGLEELDKINRLWRNGLKLYKHPDRKHFYVQISPAIERWIMNECSKAGIVLSEYGLPDGLKALVDMKSLTQRSDERFKRLFRDMLANENCDEINELKRWLVFLRDNNYNSNLDLL